MEIVRRTYKNQLLEDIRSVKTIIRQNEEAIHRLTHEKQPFRVIELVDKAKLKIKEAKEKEVLLQKQLLDVEQGLLDDQLAAERKQNSLEAKEKAEKRAAKKIALKEPKKTTKEIKKERRETFIQNKTFVSEREMAIEYDRFLRSCDKFPERLRERVAKMPNNHGILFNGIWFMGALPEKKPYDTTVIQEKDGDMFLVHYYTPDEHLIYKKEGHGRNTREVLLSREYRKRLV